MSDPSAPPVKTKAQELAAVQRFEKIVAIVTIITPFIGVIVAISLLFGGQYLRPVDFWGFFILYVITTYGLTMGYHRLFTHKSFKCIKPVRWALCVAGSMAAQGSAVFWVAHHRKHHMHSDEEDDPHSPHFAGGGVKGIVLGWWHSHVGWMFDNEPINYFRLAPDLLRDPVVMGVTRRYFTWVVLGIVLPGVVSALVTQSWSGLLTGMLWGGLVRIFFVHHTTWSINSVCHMFGAAPYESEDESRNNLACALLTFGEGWHNNHHAFPTSARHGLHWYQLDMVYILIRIMEKLRLVSDVRTPDPKTVASRLRSTKTLNTPADEEGEDGETVPLVGPETASS
ncbi:MAG TPA: acyl-CoA desaturase [Chthoniobacteraceae bacterium]|nr:acyl-CoA desaturase [Chthoniobacteraceae bacterium]